MRVHVLLSWYAEHPEWLAEMVESCAGVADSVIAVDGPYDLFAAEGASSDAEYAAIREACARVGMACHLFGPGGWRGNEVEKRAYLFGRALDVADPQDWFLVADADELVECARPEWVRGELARTDRDVAVVTLRSARWPHDTTKFRALFRALPGLTVETTHYNYVATKNGRIAYLWAIPPRLRGKVQPEPFIDLAGDVLLHHRSEPREALRAARRENYYKVRDRARIEF